MDTWVWIVIAIVVIAVVVALAVMLGRRRNESRLNQRLEKAEELRTRGQEEDLHAMDQAAEAARQQADAQRARMEAERLEGEAQKRAAEADRARQAAQSHLQDASRLDPGDHNPGARQADDAVGRPEGGSRDGATRVGDDPDRRRGDRLET